MSLVPAMGCSRLVSVACGKLKHAIERLIRQLGEKS